MKLVLLPLLLVFLAGCASPSRKDSAIVLGMSIANAEDILAHHRAERSTAVPWTTRVAPPEYAHTYSISQGRLLTVFFNKKTDEVFGMGLCKPTADQKGFTDRSEVHRVDLPPR
jgi:hypothetical protein